MENVAQKPKGRRNRGERISQSEKNQSAAGQIMQRLRENAQGTLKHKGQPYEMTPSQIKSAELFLAKTVPSLSAVEQTNIEEGKTPDQLMATLKAMLENPSTRHMLKQMLEDSEPNLKLVGEKE